MKLKVKPRDSITNFNKLDIGDYFVNPTDLHSLYILTQDKKALHLNSGKYEEFGDDEIVFVAIANITAEI